MTRKLQYAALLVCIALVSSACGSGTDESADEPETTLSDQPTVATTVAVVDDPEPAATVATTSPVRDAESTVFDFTPTPGISTWPDDHEYERLGVQVGSWPLDSRISAADLVLIVDVLSVSAPVVNSSTEEWWHVPRENQTVPDIDVSMPVTVRVVSIVKARTGEVEGRSEPALASSVRVANLPTTPEPGETLTISVPGGAVELRVPDSEWDAYTAEVESYNDSDGEERVPAGTSDDNPGSIVMAREPGFAISEGVRYVLIVDGMEVRNRDGSSYFSWRPTFTYELGQLEVDPSGAFLEPEGQIIDAGQFFDAVASASRLDAADTAIHYDLSQLEKALGLSD